MLIEEKFTLGQIVFLKTDPDQYPRIVTGIEVRPNNVCLYLISMGASQEMTYYDIELSEVKDFTLTA